MAAPSPSTGLHIAEQPGSLVLHRAGRDVEGVESLVVIPNQWDHVPGASIATQEGRAAAAIWLSFPLAPTEQKEGGTFRAEEELGVSQRVLGLGAPLGQQRPRM